MIIALLYEQDSNHDEAKKIMKNIQSSEHIYINELVYYETITVLTYKLGIIAYKRVNGLLSLLNVHFISSSRKEYGDFFAKIKRKISIQDTGVIFDAIENDFFILTLDQQQMNIFIRYLQK